MRRKVAGLVVAFCAGWVAGYLFMVLSYVLDWEKNR